MVLVDGRARLQCVVAALPYLRGSGGAAAIVLFHDWSRVGYHVVLEFYDVVATYARPPAEQQVDGGDLAVLRAKPDWAARLRAWRPPVWW